MSYTKETSIEEGIRNYQYLDRLAALYQEHGVELHRRQPGFLTGTNIPPSIAIITCVLDALLAAAQGVSNYGLELGQTLHLVQDAAAIRMCGELCRNTCAAFGFDDVFTPVTSLHWMGAWPHDEAQCGGARRLRRNARRRSAAPLSVTTKSDARGVRHSDAEGQRRRPAHDAHGDLPRAPHPARRHAGVRSARRT